MEYVGLLQSDRWRMSQERGQRLLQAVSAEVFHYGKYTGFFDVSQSLESQTSLSPRVLE